MCVLRDFAKNFGYKPIINYNEWVKLTEYQRQSLYVWI